MKSLHKLKLSSLTHLEAGQLVKRNVSDLASANVDISTDVHIKTYVLQMTQDANLFDQAIIQIKKQEETDLLLHLDHNRDVSFAILKRQLNVYELSNVTEELDAYTSLSILFASYKTLPKLNYEAESNAIVNLVADLRNAKYAPLVNTLNIGSYVTRLENANTEFNVVFSKRNIENAAAPVYNAKKIRKTMLENYTSFANYALALSKATDDAYHNGILDIINTARKYFSDLLAKRTGGVAPSTPPTI